MHLVEHVFALGVKQSSRVRHADSTANGPLWQTALHLQLVNSEFTERILSDCFLQSFLWKLPSIALKQFVYSIVGAAAKLHKLMECVAVA